MTQFTYAALWDYAKEVEYGTLTVAQAEKLCRAERNRVAKARRSAGEKVRTFVLRNQTREYWRFGEPCGLSCTVYGLQIIGYVGSHE